MRTIWLAVAIVGCAHPDYASVDDACRGDVRGASELADGADRLARVDCYRSYLGLSRLKVSAGLVRTSASQASWWGAHDGWAAPNASDVMAQKDADAADFLGATPRDRAIAAGILSADEQDRVMFERVITGDLSADAWIDDPWMRDVLFQPGLEGIAVARAVIDGTPRWVVDAIVAMPAAWNIATPVVWPVDSAADVPTTWAPSSGLDNDPAGPAPRGYPVTVTIAGSELSVVPFNPYGIVEIDATLSDAAGATVPSKLVAPGAAFPSGFTLATVSLLPSAPLEPDSAYYVHVKADSSAGAFEAHTSFRTAP